MDKVEKMQMMDKMLRELEDITNSQTSLLKKIAQVEADNINLGNRVLESKLPEIHAHVDDSLIAATSLKTEFNEVRDKFVSDNKLGETLPEANV